MEDYYSIFNTSASEYWDVHYNFGIRSSKRKKRLTKKFIDLLLLNTIIPLKFSYSRYISRDISEDLINLASNICAEDNTVIKLFNELRPIAINSLQTQALLQLKDNYCSKNKCLQCAVGSSILKTKS